VTEGKSRLVVKLGDVPITATDEVVERMSRLAWNLGDGPERLS